MTSKNDRINYYFTDPPAQYDIIAATNGGSICHKEEHGINALRHIPKKTVFTFALDRKDLNKEGLPNGKILKTIQPEDNQSALQEIQSEDCAPEIVSIEHGYRDAVDKLEHILRITITLPDQATAELYYSSEIEGSLQQALIAITEPGEAMKQYHDQL